MLQTVRPVGPAFPDLVLQHNEDLMQVGIGLEPRTEVPNAHFIDAIYGGVPTQTAIAKTLLEKLRELGVSVEQPDFFDSDSEAEWLNSVGRATLDSVIANGGPQASLFTWIDRPAVNRLIRLLRKARDSAFGKDE